MRPEEPSQDVHKRPLRTSRCRTARRLIARTLALYQGHVIEARHGPMRHDADAARSELRLSNVPEERPLSGNAHGSEYAAALEHDIEPYVAGHIERCNLDRRHYTLHELPQLCRASRREHNFVVVAGVERSRFLIVEDQADAIARGAKMIEQARTIDEIELLISNSVLTCGAWTCERVR